MIPTGGCGPRQITSHTFGQLPDLGLWVVADAAPSPPTLGAQIDFSLESCVICDGSPSHWRRYNDAPERPA
jgi:hypothetical protein